MTQSSPSVLRKKWPLLALVLAAIVALIVVIWQLQTSPETNDAYVYADTIDVVPEVSGRIVEMPIRDNQRVKKGDLLFRIDPRPYQAMLDDAKSRLAALDAQIMLTQRTIKAQQYNAQSVSAAVERAKALVKQTTSTRIRLEPLVPQGFAAQEDLDQARTAEKAARAELEATLLQAKQADAAVTGVDAMVAQRAGIVAQIALAELHLEFTEVRAPFNGVVIALKTTVGQYASALKPVFTLLDNDHWYVIANFRETDLQNVRPGVPATVTVMTNHSRPFDGVVDSVGSGVLPEGGSVIGGLPVIQKSINWVHVSQRFPVKIAGEKSRPGTVPHGRLRQRRAAGEIRVRHAVYFLVVLATGARRRAGAGQLYPAPDAELRSADHPVYDPADPVSRRGADRGVLRQPAEHSDD